MSQILAKLRPVKEPQSKAQHFDLHSGPPQTHPSLTEDGVTCEARALIEHRDQFVCAGAVDMAKLLRGSRSSLVEKAMTLGANVLVDEQYVL